MKNKKIVSLNRLVQLTNLAKKAGKKVVLCHGVFDLLHIGHIKHFQEAKKFGDFLVVTVTPDIYVSKGPNRPVFQTHLRLEALAALTSINYVAENEWSSASQTIKLIKPNIYCKGPDYKNHGNDITKKIKEETNAIRSVKGEIKYTQDISFSSSKLLNTYGVLNDSQKFTINKIKSRFNFNEIKKKIDSIKNLKVLVIGETIIDQYYFCEALGKSGKEPLMMFLHRSKEQYAGGVLANVKHISDFCKSVTVLTMLGENKEHISFIKKNLPKNAYLKFIAKKNAPTIVKKKYVDALTKNKLYGVYEMNDENLNKNDEKKFNKLFSKLINKHDLVILSDYGHGFISKKSANIICKKSNFLVLNAQLNAGNLGHHTINQYKNSECIIINESELRHELRDKNEMIEKLMIKTASMLRAKNLVVTRGNRGAILYDNYKKKFIYCSAFASKIVDKIGAGDAMLSILAILLKKEFDKNLSLFLGSLASAQSVESIGNSKSVDKVKLLKSLQHLLK